jgi:hypothetical protein
MAFLRKIMTWIADKKIFTLRTTEKAQRTTEKLISELFNLTGIQIPLALQRFG